MNEQQATRYYEIKNAYAVEPRYSAAKATLADLDATDEDRQWAVSECASLERSAHRSAEQARVGGGL